MKRLVTLMLACAAILVMAIAATAVRASDGSDDNGTQTCDVRQGGTEPGDDNGTDARAIASEDRNGTSGDDNEQGTSGDDDIQGRAGDDDLQGEQGDDDLCGDQGDDDINGGPGD